MARWPVAIWQPGSPQGGSLNPQAVTLHHQAGNGNPINVYKSRNVSAHFWIPKSGTPYQHVDTNVQSFHGMNHNSFSIGVETEGCGTAPHAEPLTEHQINMFAELMKWCNQVHRIPLILSENVRAPGLNYHRVQGFSGATGCPCDIRVNSRSEILRRAGSSSPITPPQEDDLPLNDADKAWITNTVHEVVVNLMRSPEWSGTIRNADVEALRGQFNNPDGECFNRVIQACNNSLQQNGVGG